MRALGMARTKFMLVMAALFVACGVRAAGIVVDDSFTSLSLGGVEVPVKIYLPEGYATDGDPYRLYIFLHGSGNQWAGTHATTVKNAMDARIAAGDIDPMVAVLPTLAGAPWDNVHQYTDSEVNGNYESVVMIDLLQWLEDNPAYNIAGDRQHRAIAGFSSGGYGAAHLGIRHPDSFVAFLSYSGDTALDVWRDFIQYAISESPESVPPYTFDPSNGYWTENFFGLAASFSPNLENPPYFVDFPILPSGEPDEATFSQWIVGHDPASLVDSGGLVDGAIGMFVEAGTNDIALPFNELLHAQLTDRGMRHTYNVVTGGHFVTQARIEAGLLWLDPLMDGSSSSVPEDSGRSQPVCRFGAVPNPITSETTVSLEFDSPTWADVEIVDAGGRTVLTLSDPSVLAGNVRLNFKPASLPAGTYFIRVHTPGPTLSRKVTVVR